MIGLILITENKDFSNFIKEYFHQKDKTKDFSLPFLVFGTNEDTEESIKKEILNFSEKKKNEISKFIIFSDIGDSFKIAKKIQQSNEEKFIFSNGSIIENSFIVFSMLNSKAPFESIKKFLETSIDKKEYY